MIATWFGGLALTASSIAVAAETQGEDSGLTNVAESHANDVFPPFDPTTFASQLFWLALSFGALYWLMNRVVIPRIGGILETRRDRISQDLDEAQRLKEESDAAHAAYEHELAEARGHAHAIAQDARDKAKSKADAEREAVERDLSEQMAGAERQIEEIKNKALAEVDEIAVETTEAIVKQLIGGTLTKSEVTKAVAEAAR